MINATRLATVARKLAPSAFVFLSGVGALYLADLIIAAYGDVQSIALWATLKSFMMIASTFALFGINQLLVREPKAMRQLARVGGMNILGVSLVLGTVGAYFNLVPSIITGIIVIVGFSFCNMAFQWLRSNLCVTEAYVANSGWRVIFCLGILVFFLNDYLGIDTVLIGAFVVTAPFIVILLVRHNPKEGLISLHNDIRSVKDIYLLGGSYFIAALSLAIASYGENLVVHHIGTTEDVAYYFRAAVVFLFPGLMLNQYLTTVLGTVVRQEEGRVLEILRRYFWSVALGLALLWPILAICGYLLEILIYGTTQTSLAFAAILTLTSCVRLLYVLPGSFVGVIADRRTLFHASVTYLVCALLLPLLSFILHSMGFTVVLAVALASLISWSLRCIIGARLVAQRLSIAGSINQ
jgi:O-antigen/teichoic acid export membrane protein